MDNRYNLLKRLARETWRNTMPKSLIARNWTQRRSNYFMPYIVLVNWELKAWLEWWTAGKRNRDSMPAWHSWHKSDRIHLVVGNAAAIVKCDHRYRSKPIPQPTFLPCVTSKIDSDTILWHRWADAIDSEMGDMFTFTWVSFGDYPDSMCIPRYPEVECRFGELDGEQKGIFGRLSATLSWRRR